MQTRSKPLKASGTPDRQTEPNEVEQELLSSKVPQPLAQLELQSTAGGTPARGRAAVATVPPVISVEADLSNLHAKGYLEFRS